MRAAGLVILLLLGACAQQPGAPQRGGSGFGPMVQVCDDTGCRMQPTASVVSDAGDDRRMSRQEDPDLYRGEPTGPLRDAAVGGDAGSAYRLGQAYEAGAGGLARNAVQAARHYAAAAEAGMPWASYRLARLVEQGVAPGGRARAIQLYAAAANGGVAQAAHNLGVASLGGRGLPQDAPEALRWFTIAAEGGVPESQYNLALMYFRGEGTPRRSYEALQWMRRAGENGIVPAQVACGRLYMTGLEEMGQDMQEAQKWLGMAAARGDAEARRLLPGVTRAAQQDRANYQAYQQQFALQAAYTRAFWYSAVWAWALSPPLYVVRVY